MATSFTHLRRYATMSLWPNGEGTRLLTERLQVRILSVTFNHTQARVAKLVRHSSGWCKSTYKIISTVEKDRGFKSHPVRSIATQWEYSIAWDCARVKSWSLREFKSLCSHHHGLVSQLGRLPLLQRGSRGFNSLRVHYMPP